MDINLQEMFTEPTVGSVELLDDYDELWAEVLDDSASSVTSNSMLTAQEGWSSDLEERDQSVMEQQEDEALSTQPRVVYQEHNQLMDDMAGVKDEPQVSGMCEREVARIQNVRRWDQLMGDGMMGKVIHERGNNIIKWFNFKLHQCMFATWTNGAKSGVINGLDLWDLTELRFMMGKPSRNTHYTNSPKIQGKTLNITSIVHSPTHSLSAQKPLPSLPLSIFFTIPHNVLYRHP